MLENKLELYTNSDFSRFHMPGHKGHVNLCYDVTELDCTDDLYDSNGSIINSENLISKIYGSSSTIFSTQGNTLCIQTMISLSVPVGGSMLVTRNCHKSVVNSMALLGISPIWVDIEENSSSSTDKIIEKIKESPKVDSVFVTSPDYFGQLLEIDKIKSACEDIPLLVDNSHGSHLLFFNKHPLQLGADLCADSAHKTLPVLTGGAWLHLGKSFSEKRNLNYYDAKDKMMIFSSTSPSFLTLVSLERCARWIKKYGKSEFENLKEKVDHIKQISSDFILNDLVDPVRITFDTKNIGLTSDEFLSHLESFEIKSEFGVETKTVLIPSPFNDEKDWNRLDLAIKNIPFKPRIELQKNKNIIHKQVMSIRDSMFADFEKVSLNDSIGRISAQIVAKCPPGIPIIVPGEIISEKKLKLIKDFNLDYIKVVK